jgi:hypothetical protein
MAWLKEHRRSRTSMTPCMAHEQRKSRACTPTRHHDSRWLYRCQHACFLLTIVSSFWNVRFRLLAFINVFFVCLLVDRPCLGHRIIFFDIQFECLDRPNRFPHGAIPTNMSKFSYYI